MKLRIWGTEEECAAMVALIRAKIPDQYIKSISGWYRNDRRGEFSTEGRVYCDFRDMQQSDLKRITGGRGMTDPTNTIPAPYQSGKVELKPCPFCGGEPYIAKRRFSWTDDDEAVYYGVGCKKCRVQFSCSNDLTDASEEWNKRISEEGKE